MMGGHVLFWVRILMIISCTIMGYLFIFPLRQRHHQSIRYMFTLCGIFFTLLAMMGIVGIIRSSGHPEFQIVNTILAVFLILISLACTITLSWNMPKISKIPSIQDLHEINYKLRGEVLELQKHLDKLDAEASIRAAHKLKEASQLIEEVKIESSKKLDSE